MENALVVVEDEVSISVAWADDPADWVACFQKTPGFPAREWAEHMAHLYNQRSGSPTAETPEQNVYAHPTSHSGAIR